MVLRLEDKKAIVAEINEIANRALSLVVVDARGVSVPDMVGIRAEANAGNVYMRVVRNTLIARAVVGTDFEVLAESLEGPSLLAFSMDSPGAAARLCKKHAAELEQFNVRSLVMGGELLPVSSLEAMASLPTYEEGLGLLAGTLQAPVSKFARTANEVVGKFVRTLAAYRDQQQAA